MHPERLKTVVFHPRLEVYRALLGAVEADTDFVFAQDEAALTVALNEAQILITLACPPVVIERGKALRWIQTTSSGVDPLVPHHKALREIAVTNARGIHADQIGDFVMASMVNLLWNMPRLVRRQAERDWQRETRPPLAGSTLGIIGLGAVAKGIIRRARASGMEVVGLSRSGAPAEGVSTVYRREALHEMLARCDFVALVVPGTPDTERMIDAAALHAMKPCSFLINVARGSVVDEVALIEALRDGIIAGAALDVFAVEPLPVDNPLWAMPNVIVTPHLAGMSSAYDAQVVQLFLDNLARLRRGEPLHNLVDLSRGY